MVFPVLRFGFIIQTVKMLSVSILSVHVDILAHFPIIYHVQIIYIVITSDPTQAPSKSPSIAPTTVTLSPTVACEEDDLATFDWDDLISYGVDEPQFQVTVFEVDAANLALHIQVELDYLGKVSGDDEDNPNFGVSYILDFEDYDAHQAAISEPGTCQNRDADTFIGVDFDDYWFYSLTPELHIGEAPYLAYPPPGDYWSIWMKEGEECDTVVYDGIFSWNDLTSCTSYDNGVDDPVDYIVTEDGDKLILLNGTFYINVVSPFASGEDTGYYRIYQLLSKPFVIAIEKSIQVLGSTGINVLSMSIIAVYKEDGANTFRLIVLTEAQEYLLLSRSNTSLYLFNPSGNAQIEQGEFTVPDIAVTNDEGCLDNKNFICSQLWEIRADDVDCHGNDKGIDFSGDYTLQFVPECRDGVYATYCDNWLANHSDIADGVNLVASLTWQDLVCDPQIFTVQFEASMNFYMNVNYTNINDGSELYEVGEDSIYVEIDTSFPTDSFDVFDTDLLNVWICTFDPLEGPSMPIEETTLSGGCFSDNRDGGNTSIDNPYFYHIWAGYSGSEQEGFTLIGHPLDDAGDEIQNILRFSFIVPNKIARDTLYIHAQVEVSLVESSRRRRVLLSSATANQMEHFLGHIEVGQDSTNHDPVNNDKPESPEQAPYDYNPNPIEPVSPSTPISTWTINLSSPYVIGIGCILAALLSFNILFLCYQNCSKHRQSRFSFNRARRSGYDSVKIIESEIEPDSEIPMIQQSE